MNNKKRTISFPFKRKKWILFCLAVIPFLILILSLTGFRKQSLTLFPSSDVQNRLRALGDRFNKGKSEILEFAYDKKVLSMKYILRDGAPNPLVFFTFNLGTPEKTLDFSHFETVSIRIREATNKRIVIFLKTYVPGISLPESNKTHTLRHNEYILQLIPGRQLYTIKLKDFMTPYWWLGSMRLKEAELPVEQFHNVVSFDMQINREGTDYILNQPEHILIDNITFHSPLPVTYYVLLWTTIFYGCGGLILLSVILVKKRKNKLLQRKPLEIFSYRDTEIQRIKEFIEANYFQEDISTHTIYKILGIPPARIFKLIKKEYNLTFKQLINKLRIEEAKRLLKKTDLRIIDIAVNLGFNNVTYFNIVFKQLEGIAPSDYRKRKSRLQQDDSMK